MKKTLVRVLAAILVLVMVLPAVVSCGEDPTPDPNPNPGPSDTPDDPNKPDEPDQPDNPSVPATYTMHDYMGAGPTNWNPHTWETNADSLFSSYAEMGFVDVSIADDGVNFEWVYEMATDIEDVTAEYLADPEKASKWIKNSAGEMPKDDAGNDVTSGCVYRIHLNPNAKWANGVAINADTYVYSMQQLLDPKMQNYRANTYYNGDSAVKNGASYFYSDSPIFDYLMNTEATVEELLAEGSLLMPITQPVPMIGMLGAGNLSFVDFDSTYAGYGYCDIPEYDAEGNLVFVEAEGGAYVLVDGEYVEYDPEVHGEEVTLYDVSYISIAEKYKNLKDWNNGYGYIVIDEDNYEEVIRDVTAWIGSWLTDPSEASGYLPYVLAYNTGERTEKYDWANVGLLKVDDYTIDYVLEAPSTEYYFLVSCTSNWIVYEELYEAGKKAQGELIVTTYGTDLDSYMSYGPYKVDTYEKDKQITMSRNENWYGWTDGEHVGQYQTTNIVIDIIADEATIESLFLAGKLDGLGLNASQLAKYRNSEYLLKTDQTYTFRFIFMSDLNDLKALEETRANGKNLQVLSYDDFRKAISLAIDRAKLCAQGTGGYKPAYYLFNSLYYYDVENNPDSIYRNTEYAKQAVLDLYGITYGPSEVYKTLDEAYEAITGYDLVAAKELFTAVYEQAIADGTYTAGQEIEIQCMASGAATLSEDDSAQERLMNEFVAAATAGTPFEGKITFKFFAGAANRYLDVAEGRQEMIRGAWGGAAFYPFSTIRCYTEPDYMGGLNAIHESNGWDPTKESLTLTYDFNGDGTPEEVTHMLDEWAISINGGNAERGIESYTNADAKLYIMARLENAVLGSYQCIPWASETACSLFSQKISYATLDYNIMYGYGGIRLMTYNFSDAEWEAYVESQGGKLSY